MATAPELMIRSLLAARPTPGPRPPLRGTRRQPPPRERRPEYPQIHTLAEGPGRVERRAEASPRVRPRRSTIESRAVSALLRTRVSQQALDRREAIMAARHPSARV